MTIFTQILGALLAIILVMLFLCLVMTLTASLKSKAIICQINSGRMSDAKLISQYNNFKKWKDNKIVAILMSGICYKYYLKMQNKIFDAYKEGMINRNLPL